jgi:hypothetical protein
VTDAATSVSLTRVEEVAMARSGLPSPADRLQDVQAVLAARALLLVAVLAPAFLVSTDAPMSFGGVAAAAGSVALIVAAWQALAPVVLQALALGGAPGATLPRERISACRRIRRPEEPGRPGRARPRAPGVALRPRPAC